MTTSVPTIAESEKCSREADRIQNAAYYAGRLTDWFGVSFAVVDASTGDVLYGAEAQPCGDWATRGELCRAMVHVQQPEIIAEDGPISVLALPPTRAGGEHFVATATFVGRHDTTDGEVDAVARSLGLKEEDASHWIQSQPIWSAEAALAMGRVCLEQLSAEQNTEALEDEIESLSDNLASTYEEISLLYRLTQNLKISSREDELGNVALQWLSVVLPAEGLALQLVPTDCDENVHSETRSEPQLLTFGHCPLDNEQFTELANHVRTQNSTNALVANQAITAQTDWPFPAVRNLIAIPLVDGERLYGWLAAVNHTEEGEFGTVEASLLNSVGAIFTIHCSNTDLYRQQAEFLGGVVHALTSAIDAKDPYTCGHSDRVARVAVRLGVEMGLDAEQLNTLYLSGLLHDVGKIGIDDNVLRKPGKLTDAEYEHIKTHPALGHNILKDIKQLDQVLPVVLHHHEQWDGRGYPLGLEEETTPLLARITAVADAFDAMGSDRPYRKGMADEKLDGILQNGAGQQWDPEVVAAFFAAREDIRDIANHEREGLSLNVEQWT